MKREQIDLIHNALVVGMDVSDAYIYAGMTPAEIAAAEDDDDLQMEIAQLRKQHEYALLRRLDDIIEKQKHMGKEGAVTWALEHMYPRYGNKPTADGQPLTINLDVRHHNADIEIDE